MAASGRAPLRRVVEQCVLRIVGADQYPLGAGKQAIDMRTKALTAALLAIYLCAGLYPFHWQWPSREVVNAAQYTSEPLLSFAAPGIAYTVDAPPWLAAAIAARALEISLQLRSTGEATGRTTRILAISASQLARNFTLDQRDRDLVLRAPVILQAASQAHYLTVPDVFAAPGWHALRITLSADHVRVDVDGRSRLQEPVPADWFASWSTDYRLALGNEFNFNRAWLGEIRQLVIATPGQTVDYLQPGRLTVPARYSHWRHYRQLYSFFFADENSVSRAAVMDWAINVLGFIPCGFWILCLSRGKRSLLIASIGSAGLSLSIECLQFFLADRSTSIDDLVLNTLGGALGAWLALLWLGWRRRSSAGGYR